MTLNKVSIGQTVTVKKMSGQEVAPLGDPIELTVRGYQLSLRKADAEMVEVE